jgi:hypothetical protein
MEFYTRDGSAAISAAIGADATFGSQALLVSDLNSPASTSKPVIGLLPITFQLANVNDYVALTFSFHFVNNASVTANAANFRFGIFSSTGTPVTSDSQTTSDNDRGYYVQVGSSGTIAPASTNVFYNEGGTILPVLASTDRVNIPASAAGVAINNNNVHTAAFTVTRINTTSISLSLIVDGGVAITGTDSTANIRTSFDEIAFSDGFQNPALNYVLDDIAVGSNLPEPSSPATATASALILAIRRRRSQRPA